MNYGITVLGATLVISHFLWFCGVMAYEDPLETFREIQRDYFASRYGETELDETVKGWLTRDPLLRQRNLVEKFWRSDNQQASLQTFLSHSPQRRAETSQTSRNAERAELCKFEESQRNFKRSSNSSGDSYGDGDYDEIPAGCSFHDENQTLICDGISTLPSELPGKLELFELNGSKVRVLPSGALSTMEVKTVRIHGNELLCIHPNAFEGVKGLKILSISNNELEYIRPEDFQNLTEVYMLYLEHNQINLVNYPSYNWVGYDAMPDDVDSSYVLPSLMWLSLMGNPLEILPRNYFYPLRKSPVAYLKLTNCQIRFVQPGAFSHLPNLSALDLSENPILMSSLAEAFEEFKPRALKELNLANNNLAFMPTDALAKVSSSLETLDLSGNLLDTITSSCFPADIGHLKSLNLDSCRIRTVGANTFEHLTNLETLILSNNRLSEIPPPVSILTNLLHFDLSGNKPSATSSISIGVFQPEFCIPPNVFANMTKLRTLYMNQLPLRAIERTSFVGPSNLELLSVESSAVTSIANYSFANLTKLRTLNLNFNVLTKLYDITFYGLQNLDSLYLEWNRIEFPCQAPVFQWPVWKSRSVKPFQGFPTAFGGLPDENNSTDVEPFRYLPKLKRLKLANNNIRSLNTQLFEHLPSLEQVDLSGNFIHSWTTPLILSGSVIKNFSVSHNGLGPVSPAMLMDFQALQLTAGDRPSQLVLDISDNPFVCDENVCDMMRLVQNQTLKLNRIEERLAHSCIDTATSKYYRLSEILGTLCFQNGTSEATSTTATANATTPTTTMATVNITDGTTTERSSPSFTQSGTPILLLNVGIICLCILSIASVGTLCYRKRFHIKYFWFVVKYNVVNLPDLSAAEKKRSEAGEHFDYDIFVSYNHMDKDFIQDYLVPNLEGDDVEVNGGYPLRICIHERDFQVGVPITENIVDFVDKSRKVVVVVSRNYLQSQWCLYEMNLAYHRLIESGRKSFVVVLLEDIPSSLRTKSLNYLLVSRTYLQWPGTNASYLERTVFWKRLRQSLKALDSH